LAGLPDAEWRPRARRAVAVPARGTVHVFAAAIATASPDPAIGDRLELIDELVAKLREDRISEADLKSLQSLIDAIHGRVKVKVVHKVIGETEI
jgi:hypothetical protein